MKDGGEQKEVGYKGTEQNRIEQNRIEQNRIEQNRIECVKKTDEREID